MDKSSLGSPFFSVFVLVVDHKGFRFFRLLCEVFEVVSGLVRGLVSLCALFLSFGSLCSCDGLPSGAHGVSALEHRSREDHVVELDEAEVPIVDPAVGRVIRDPARGVLGRASYLVYGFAHINLLDGLVNRGPTNGPYVLRLAEEARLIAPREPEPHEAIAAFGRVELQLVVGCLLRYCEVDLGPLGQRELEAGPLPKEEADAVQQSCDGLGEGVLAPGEGLVPVVTATTSSGMLSWSAQPG